MTRQVLLGIDIGATSVKTGAFSVDGKLLAVQSQPNAPVPQPDSPAEWRIWDVDDIWKKICDCSKSVMSQLGEGVEVGGIAVSGFGVDGVPMKKDGSMLYPCISWHCGRTMEHARNVSEKIGDLRLYNTTGYHNYHINTLNRFVWMNDNVPHVIEEMDNWLHVQDYIVYKLSGEFSTEKTIASQSMCLDVTNREWAEDILTDLGIPLRIFSPSYESGVAVGKVTPQASQESGIPAGSVVCTGGHDTELAILGSGVNRKETFLDINGTWEILLAISDTCNPNQSDYDHGLDWECHALPGWWNCQSLMIAGGGIEWIKNNFYRDSQDYQTIIEEAKQSKLGANNVYILPAFVRGMGPAQAHDPLGTIMGINTQTTRGDIARAMFEGLTYQFYQQINTIEKSLNIKADTVCVTGGGQKNPFWMQMKADMSGRALTVLQDVESSLLGAAIVAGLGSGVYKNAVEAIDTISFPAETIEPNPQAHEFYKNCYDEVVSKIPETLENTYTTIHTFSDNR